MLKNCTIVQEHWNIGLNRSHSNGIASLLST